MLIWFNFGQFIFLRFFIVVILLSLKFIIWRDGIQIFSRPSIEFILLRRNASSFILWNFISAMLFKSNCSRKSSTFRKYLHKPQSYTSQTSIEFNISNHFFLFTCLTFVKMISYKDQLIFFAVQSSYHHQVQQDI